MALPDLHTPTTLHATAVALSGRALLICGAAGSGKSGLALSLMALGADLIADDRALLDLSDGVPWLSAPPTLPPLIEARGIGLLNAPRVPGGWVTAVVDLDTVETERLPPERHVAVLGHERPLVRRVDSPHFAPALLHYLKAGRSPT